MSKFLTADQKAKIRDSWNAMSPPDGWGTKSDYGYTGTGFMRDTTVVVPGFRVDDSIEWTVTRLDPSTNTAFWAKTFPTFEQAMQFANSLFGK